ncbi:hypothetical protein [Legionella cincinnatiensis]|uniref:Uncharacterized protein n=1 Tax=Legionella cincinnatiensis TaxID=28085 RepID=A0A378IJ54_9GAMM|nr:hypothetical protein [Legionella cincinnatiensis]KTC81945.1 hypothetical protein Lcin_3015 [Legionella cincinnatiensis]STX34725.1 Uncharacterised protein [Legionella cincinnatiensis]
MKAKYTANAYCNEEKIATEAGDDVDKPYAWMVLQANGNFGDVHGEIIDNKTHEVVKTFQKTYLD